MRLVLIGQLGLPNPDEFLGHQFWFEVRVKLRDHLEQATFPTGDADLHLGDRYVR